MLFDLNILIIAFRRPGLLEEQLRRMDDFGIKNIYVFIDGINIEACDLSIRRENDECRAVLNKFAKRNNDRINVSSCLPNSNLGCRFGPEKAISWFFENVEMGVILEDDCIPQADFLSFSRDLLMRYQYEDEVMMISGNQFLNFKAEQKYSYYFSRHAHIWGWATWRRSWSKYHDNLDNWNSYKISSHFKKVINGNIERNYWINEIDSILVDNKLDTWDYVWKYCIWRENGKVITPYVNLVSNVGFGYGATHTKDGNIKSRQVEKLAYPLRHPQSIGYSYRIDKEMFKKHIAPKYYSKHRFNPKREIKHYLFLLKSLFYRNIINKKHTNIDSIHNVDSMNALISDIINSEKPSLISRFGNIELEWFVNYKLLNSGVVNRFIFFILGYIRDFRKSSDLINHTYFVPKSDEVNTKFYVNVTESAIPEIDVLGSWLKGETLKVVPLKDNIVFGTLSSIEPFFSKHPWTLALENKKVLIIHPMVDLFIEQMEKREKIFKNSLLPNFEIVPLKALFFGDADYPEWKDVYNYYRKEISTLEFDIAIVGCGTWGMTVGGLIKKNGRTAIHLGGATQLLFGVMGKRWAEWPNYKELINENWIVEHENIPEVAKQIEGGCYW